VTFSDHSESTPRFSPDGKRLAFVSARRGKANLYYRHWNAWKDGARTHEGVPSRLIVFSEAGHWPSGYEMGLYYTAHLEWFEKYLGGDGPSWTTAASCATPRSTGPPAGGPRGRRRSGSSWADSALAS